MLFLTQRPRPKWAHAKMPRAKCVLGYGGKLGHFGHAHMHTYFNIMFLTCGVPFFWPLKQSERFFPFVPLKHGRGQGRAPEAISLTQETPLIWRILVVVGQRVLLFDLCLQLPTTVVLPLFPTATATENRRHALLGPPVQWSSPNYHPYRSSIRKFGRV